MLFQETVKDCPGLVNCTVGLAGGEPVKMSTRSAISLAYSYHLFIIIIVFTLQSKNRGMNFIP